jgi:hypothetical protein
MPASIPKDSSWAAISDRGERAHLEVDRGKVAQQALGDLRHRRQRRRDHPEAQTADQVAGEARGFRRQSVDARQRLPSPAQQLLPLRGEVGVAAVAMDQFDAELGLEFADRDRERRLGDVAGPRRAAEVALLGEDGEVLQLAQEHREWR